jgi:hypothetical protein
MLRFAYRLGTQFGKLDPVGEILMKLSTRQLVYWMAYFGLEPLAADRDDKRAALHTAFLADRLSLADEATDPNDLVVDWVAQSEPVADPPPPVDPIAEADALILAIQSRFGHTKK